MEGAKHVSEATDRFEHGLSFGQEGSPAFSYLCAGYYDAIVGRGMCR